MVTNVHTGWPGFRGRKITLGDVAGYLHQAIPVIFLCRNCRGTTLTGGTKSYGGHFMVLRSVGAAGTTFRVLDPGGFQRPDIETISLRELRRHVVGYWVVQRI